MFRFFLTHSAFKMKCAFWLIASSFFVAVQRYDWFSRKSRSHTSWPSGSAVSSKHQRFVSPGFDGSNRGTVEVPQSRPATVSARARVEQRFHGFFQEDVLRVEGDQQSGSMRVQRPKCESQAMGIFSGEQIQKQRYNWFSESFRNDARV